MITVHYFNNNIYSLIYMFICIYELIYIIHCIQVYHLLELNLQINIHFL